MAALDEGHTEDATSKCDQAYRIHRRRNDLLHVSATLIVFARILTSVGRMAAAATVLSTSEVVQEDVGASPPWLVKGRMEAITTAHTELSDAVFAEVWERGRTLTADEAVALAWEALG
jgi:hypothetical protein